MRLPHAPAPRVDGRPPRTPPPRGPRRRQAAFRQARRSAAPGAEGVASALAGVPLADWAMAVCSLSSASMSAVSPSLDLSVASALPSSSSSRLACRPSSSDHPRRCMAVAVLQVEARRVLEQQLHDRRVAVVGSDHQGGHADAVVSVAPHRCLSSSCTPGSGPARSGTIRAVMPQRALQVRRSPCAAQHPRHRLVPAAGGDHQPRRALLHLGAPRVDTSHPSPATPPPRGPRRCARRCTARKAQRAAPGEAKARRTCARRAAAAAGRWRLCLWCSACSSAVSPSLASAAASALPSSSSAALACGELCSGHQGGAVVVVLQVDARRVLEQQLHDRVWPRNEAQIQGSHALLFCRSMLAFRCSSIRAIASSSQHGGGHQQRGLHPPRRTARRRSRPPEPRRHLARLAVERWALYKRRLSAMRLATTARARAPSPPRVGTRAGASAHRSTRRHAPHPHANTVLAARHHRHVLEHGPAGRGPLERSAACLTSRRGGFHPRPARRKAASSARLRAAPRSWPRQHRSGARLPRVAGGEAAEDGRGRRTAAPHAPSRPPSPSAAGGVGGARPPTTRARAACARSARGLAAPAPAAMVEDRARRRGGALRRRRAGTRRPAHETEYLANSELWVTGDIPISLPLSHFALKRTVLVRKRPNALSAAEHRAKPRSGAHRAVELAQLEVGVRRRPSVVVGPLQESCFRLRRWRRRRRRRGGLAAAAEQHALLRRATRLLPPRANPWALRARVDAGARRRRRRRCAARRGTRACRRRAPPRLGTRRRAAPRRPRRSRRRRRTGTVRDRPRGGGGVLVAKWRGPADARVQPPGFVRGVVVLHVRVDVAAEHRRRQAAVAASRCFRLSRAAASLSPRRSGSCWKP